MLDGATGAPTPRNANSIWNDRYVTRVACAGGKEGWKCGWCNMIFYTLHATRVVCHMAKVKGNNIAICKAIIPPSDLARYQAIRGQSTKSAAARKKAREDIDDFIDDRLDAATESVLETNYQPNGTGARKPSASSTMLSFVTRSKKNNAGTKRKSASFQPSIEASVQNLQQTDIRRSNDVQLKMAIADLIHCDGLPFSFTVSPRFRKVLRVARTVGDSFVPPTRALVSGDLLDRNFETCVELNNQELSKEAVLFGLTVLGDGATVKKMPLINILGMAGNTPPTVLAIHDCTAHMADGGKKDAPYIASLFESYLDDLDPNRDLTDVIFFDGASNVQKAGRILEAKFPCAHCIHGGEHVISLFFDDIAKLDVVQASD